MKIIYSIEEALQALRSNLLRSSLTIIGIVVGIFSVTMMLALGAGLSSNILDTFNSFIKGDITISGELTATDLAWVREQKFVAGALATADVRDVIVNYNGATFYPIVQLPLGNYVEVSGITILEGQAFDFSSTTYSAKVAVVDQGFVSAVLEDAKITVAVGDTITINGQPYELIAVMEGGTSGFGRMGDGTILIPYKSAVGVLTSTSAFTSIAVDLVDQAYYEVVAKHFLETLNTARAAPKESDDYFSVNSAQSAIEEAQNTTAMLSLFLGLIGGIALFVGGIGTMNMMLTTVTERTKEIGLRKAIGARDRDILAQILAESVMLTVIGGLIGIALTYGVSMIINQFIPADSFLTLKLSSSVVVLATVVSFLVGIIFGLYPARNAARLQPVDALRAD